MSLSPHSTNPAPVHQQRNAFRIALITVVLVGFLTVMNTLQAVGEGNFAAPLNTGLLTLIALVSLWLVRRGRVILAMNLIIAQAILQVLVAPLVVAGVAMPVAVMTVILVLAISSATLPPKEAGRAVLVSNVAAAAGILLDTFGSPQRFVVPDATGPTIAAGVLLLVYGFLVLRQFAHFELRRKFLYLFLAMALAPILLLETALSLTTRQMLITSTETMLLGGARQTAAQLDAFVISNLNSLQAEALLPELVEYLNLPAEQRPGSRHEIRAFATLDTLILKNPDHILSYALLDQSGIDRVDTRRSDLGVDRSEQEYFQMVQRTGRPYFSPLRYAPDTGNIAALFFAAPVKNTAGETVGILRVQYDAGVLQDLISQANGLAGTGAYAVLVDDQTIRLAHGTRPDLVLKAYAPLSMEQYRQLLAAGRLPSGNSQQFSTNQPGIAAALVQTDNQPFFLSEQSDWEPDAAYVGVARLRTMPWQVLMHQPAQIVLAPVETQKQIAVVLGVLCAGLVALVANLSAKRVSDPILRLSQAAAEISAGHLDVSAPVTSQDEIGELAQSFNHMAKQLRELITTLEERVADRTRAMQASAEVSRHLSTILDVRQLVLEVVTQLQKTFGYYHAHIYLWDDEHESLLLVGGTGEIGQVLVSRGHRIARGRGLVGRAAETNTPVIASDVARTIGWLPNPLLPETKSEVAVPIALAGQVLGVLDVQENMPGKLSLESAELLQSVANQVAIALQNARSYGQTRRQAEREARVNRIGQKIQAAASVQEVLQIAARELGQVFGRPASAELAPYRAADLEIHSKN